jgi:hypothetical protein
MRAMPVLLRFPPACRLLVVLVLVLMSGASAGQTLDIDQLVTLVASGMGPLNDIETLDDGRVLCAQPASQRMIVIDPATGGYGVLPLPPLVVVSIARAPNGHFYLSEVGGGAVLDLDPATWAVSTVISGFVVPEDVVFDGPSSFYLTELTSSDFFHGSSSLWHVQTGGGAAVATLVTTGIPGACDIELAPLGGLYLTSLGSADLTRLDPVTLQSTFVAAPVYHGSDIRTLAPGRLLVTALAFGEVLHVDVLSGAITTIADRLGPTGHGMDDIAFAPSGDAYVCALAGELLRIDLTSTLRQIGSARPASTFHLLMDGLGPAGARYGVACSLGLTTGLWAGGVLVPVDPDALFFATLPPRPPGLELFDGILAAGGLAIAPVALPPAPALAGLHLYFAAVSYLPAAVLPLAGVSNAARVTIVP